MRSDILSPVFVRASTETETELNVEVAFSEQALTYRDNHQRLKVASPNSPDDKLPVSHIPVHTHTRTHGHKYSHSLSCI